jgi:hypothetical protein
VTTKRPHVFLLSQYEEWPLFSVELILERPPIIWAYLSDLPDLTGRRDAWTQLFMDLRRLERWCQRDGVVGWYCATEVTNPRFMRWLHAVGATPYQADEQKVCFRKALLKHGSDFDCFSAVARKVTTITREAHA